MPEVAMSVDDVNILSDAYPDKQVWRDRVTYCDGMLQFPSDLSPPISSVDMVAARKGALLEYATQRRWQIETGGIVVSGTSIATDDRSKLLIAGARIKADANSEFTTKWKTSTGVRVLIDAATIIAISEAVLAHVDACFEIEDTVCAGIEAGTITTREQIDAAFAG